MKNKYPSSIGIAVRLRYQRTFHPNANVDTTKAEIASEKAALKECCAKIDLDIGSDPTTEDDTITAVDINNADKPIEKRIGGYFIDNGDGTVTDTSTGLSWMRCAMGQTWDGTSCMGTAKSCDWDRANVLSLSFAGHDDWRLPTIDELKTIIDPTQINSEINSATFLQTANSWLWSLTPFDDHSDYAWAINSRTGRTITLKKSKYRSIRLVLRGYVKALDSESTESTDGTLVITGKNSEQKYFTDTTAQSAKYAKPKDYAIPTHSSKPEKKISLDMNSIEAKLAETAAVSAILNNIFSEEEPVTPQFSVPETRTTEVPVPGLDPESYLFMRVLASRQVWVREELEKLAADHSLMLDGTLDSINDASFDHFGGPFFEGEDSIEIDPEILSRLK